MLTLAVFWWVRLKCAHTQLAWTVFHTYFLGILCTKVNYLLYLYGTFKTSRVPINHELYVRSCDFLFIVYSTKSRSTNQNTVTVSFISPLFVFTSETSETLRSNVGNLRKTSVEPRTPSKFFGSISEIFGRLRVNFVNLQKTSRTI